MPHRRAFLRQAAVAALATTGLTRADTEKTAVFPIIDTRAAGVWTWVVLWKPDAC
ncbi:MAG TPA: hypothetical protein VFA18_12770 [Gemmataceae bacterium]|nr:hypothetical protein [Gemmataceae bacterium]